MSAIIELLFILQLGALCGGLYVAVSKNKDRALGGLTIAFVILALLGVGGMMTP